MPVQESVEGFMKPPTFPGDKWSFTNPSSGFSDYIVLQMLLFLWLCGQLKINMT